MDTDPWVGWKWLHAPTVAHVRIHTNDLEAVVAVSGGSLGPPVRFRPRNDDGGTVGVHLGCGRTTLLELFDQDPVLAMFGVDTAVLRAAPTRLRHSCCEVTGLEPMKARLDSAQIPSLELGTGLGDALQIWIGDPDGNAVEPMEHTATSRQLVGDDPLPAARPA